MAKVRVSGQVLLVMVASHVYWADTDYVKGESRN